VKGKGDRRGETLDRNAADAALLARAALPAKTRARFPSATNSNNSDSRNGQFMREGRRARSGGPSWVILVIVLVVIGALLWFFSLRDAEAAVALLFPNGPYALPMSKFLKKTFAQRASLSPA
jgi:hypothetical protein